MDIKKILLQLLFLGASNVLAMDVDPEVQTTPMEIDHYQPQEECPLLSLPSEILVLILIHTSGPLFTDSDWKNTGKQCNESCHQYDSSKLYLKIDNMIRLPKLCINNLLVPLAQTCKQFKVLAKIVFKKHLDSAVKNYDICTISCALQKALQEKALPLVYISEHDGWTVLHWATSETKDNPKVTEILLFAAQDKESLLFACNDTNRTALHLAASKGNTEICKALILAAGSKAKDLFELRDIQGMTALKYAEYNNIRTYIYLTQVAHDLGIDDINSLLKHNTFADIVSDGV